MLGGIGVVAYFHIAAAMTSEEDSEEDSKELTKQVTSSSSSNMKQSPVVDSERKAADDKRKGTIMPVVDSEGIEHSDFQRQSALQGGSAIYTGIQPEIAL